jgi:hypothetical protein
MLLLMLPLVFRPHTCRRSSPTRARKWALNRWIRLGRRRRSFYGGRHTEHQSDALTQRPSFCGVEWSASTPHHDRLPRRGVGRFYETDVGGEDDLEDIKLGLFTQWGATRVPSHMLVWRKFLPSLSSGCPIRILNVLRHGSRWWASFIMGSLEEHHGGALWEHFGLLGSREGAPPLAEKGHLSQCRGRRCMNPMCPLFDLPMSRGKPVAEADRPQPALNFHDRQRVCFSPRRCTGLVLWSDFAYEFWW